MTTKNYIRLGIASISLIGLLLISKELSQFRLIEFIEESEYYKESGDGSFQIEVGFWGMLLIGILLFVTMYYLVNMTDLSLKVKKWISISACLAYIIIGLYGGISSYNRNSEEGVSLEESYKKRTDETNNAYEEANSRRRPGEPELKIEEYKKFRVAEPPFNRVIVHGLLCSIILLISILSFFQTSLKLTVNKTILIKSSITYIGIGIILGLLYGIFDQVLGHIRIDFLPMTAIFMVCFAIIFLLYLGGKYVFKNN
jgi:hypothetical protein